MIYRCLVCGGRSFRNKTLLYATLSSMFAVKRANLLIITGAARGADLLAQRWALENQCNYIGVPAKWDTLGKAAGTTRNWEMLDNFNPTICIAFAGGRGTAHMVSACRKRRVTVYEPV